MPSNIEAKEAVDKAKEFLENYHDTINVVSATLEDDVWVVVIDVGFLTNQIKRINVDAVTGKILGYVHVGEN